jgi:hypothetical protein
MLRHHIHTFLPTFLIKINVINCKILCCFLPILQSQTLYFPPLSQHTRSAVSLSLYLHLPVLPTQSVEKYSKVQHSTYVQTVTVKNGLTHFNAPLAGFMFVFVFVHTGVPLVLITEHKQAVEHSGCAERSVRTRSNRESTLHGLLSSLETGQLHVIHILDTTQYSPHWNTRYLWSSISIISSSTHSTVTAVKYSCVKFSFPLYSTHSAVCIVNPLNTELNPVCHFLALLGAHHILHVSRIRVKWHQLDITVSQIMQNSSQHFCTLCCQTTRKVPFLCRQWRTEMLR